MKRDPISRQALPVFWFHCSGFYRKDKQFQPVLLPPAANPMSCCRLIHLLHVPSHQLDVQNTTGKMMLSCYRNQQTRSKAKHSCCLEKPQPELQAQLLSSPQAAEQSRSNKSELLKGEQKFEHEANEAWKTKQWTKQLFTATRKSIKEKQSHLQ